MFQPRSRELLVLLALHPGGVTRSVLADALWAGKSAGRVTTALHTALARLRREVHRVTGGAITDVLVGGESVYRLDPELVEVDFWRFDVAVAARRATAAEVDRAALFSAIVDAYGGTLAEGLTTSWIEPLRQAARRDALDALAALARLSVESDPERTLELLELARGFDPHNELVYRDIMRLQARLGRLDAIPRTLALLKAHLVEIGEQPTPETVGLAVRLQRRHDAPSAPGG